MPHWVQVLIEDTAKQAHPLPNHVLDGLKRVERIVQSSDRFHFRTDEFEDIADNISVCCDLNELARLLWQAATAAQFQNFSLFMLEQGRAPIFSTRLCTSWKKSWVTQYCRKSYQFVDPVANRAHQTDGSFKFSELSQSCPMLDEYWQDAEAHGIGRNGYCHVLTRPDQSRLAMAFYTSNDEARTDEIIRLNGYDLRIIAELAIECFCYLAAPRGIDDIELTTEELYFLHTLATSPNPEAALALQPLYGSNKAMQASIRNKLNVSTVFQAISVATARNLFDALPIYEEEVLRPYPALSGWDMADMPIDPQPEESIEYDVLPRDDDARNAS